MIRTYKHRYFERFILILIIVSSIKLAFDSYLQEVPNDDIKVIVSDWIDLVFTVVFAMEMVIKVISLGFLFD